MGRGGATLPKKRVALRHLDHTAPSRRSSITKIRSGCPLRCGGIELHPTGPSRDREAQPP
ncbi:hypothetical protein SBD_8077 [Streptomyces bottropensis ATCC 25435]|uniref:Uncharacterized protein n=1 Tax=Streptomyces bottropensis ATCC 25435 TaxID=1054862 RepID=M3ENB3_9ACTN|nr:hypothetical protein SBD_8077 [Streptomyces bottropensis ATCC 25435]